MEQITQTMEQNTTELEQTPKRGRGRPKGTCKFTDEERAEKARLKSKRHYDRNPEKERERKRLEYHRKKEENIIKV